MTNNGWYAIKPNQNKKQKTKQDIFPAKYDHP